jgi:hypothetical protein
MKRIPAWLLGPALTLACRPQAPPAPVQNPTPDFVADCRPCRFQIGAGLRPVGFTFEIDSGADGRVVRVIEAQPDGGIQPQRLEVHDMTPEPPGGKFFFGAIDLNRDGFLDLLIATRRGIANTYADYWRFVPASNRFAYLGNYPIFSMDTTSHRLTTYERGGLGGRVYQAREWDFEGDSLVVLREEVQEATGIPGQFRRIVRKREADGAGLKEVSRTISHRP